MPLEAARSKERLKTNKPLMPDVHSASNANSEIETEHLVIGADAEDRLTDAAMSAAVRCLYENYPPLKVTLDKAEDCLRLIAASDLEGPAERLDVIQRKPESGEASPGRLQAEYYRLIRVLRKRLAAKLLRSDTQVWKNAWNRAIGRVDYALFRVTESSVHLHRLMPTRQYHRYE
jgi:hypothetical protein